MNTRRHILADFLALLPIIIAALAVVLAGVSVLLPMKGVAQATQTGPMYVPSKPVTGCWAIYLSPATNVKVETLSGIAAISENDVWAVGSSYPTNDKSNPFFMHWDGAQWGVVPGPEITAVHANLSRVSAVSSKDVWAVGFYTEDSNLEAPSKTLIMHWDGTKWSVAPSPNVGQLNNTLLGVAAISGSDVWAVGSYDTSTGGSKRGIILHWNGSQWSNVYNAALAQFSQLQDIAVASANDVWTVGIGGAENKGILHWNGSEWRVVPTPNSGKDGQLQGVTVLGPTDVWAVGTEFIRTEAPAKAHTLTMHWDGQVWSIAPSPNEGDQNILHAIGGVSPNDVWAVGEPFTEQPLFEHWDGHNWSTVVSPLEVRILRLSAVSALPNGNIWIAGTAYRRLPSVQNQGLIMRHSNAPCTDSMLPTPTSTMTPVPSKTLQPLPGNNSYTFVETGKTVTGVFLDYWNGHGGILQQGYPISSLMNEVSDIDGKTYTVQYFERAVFEAHPKNVAPNDVLLSLLGVEFYQQKYGSAGAPGQAPNTSTGSALFNETGHRVGGTFLTYWQTHGGLAQQGYPISDEFTEVSALDGKSYTVQYFQRAVFELHPENAGTEYEVLLSQLGTPRYRAMYVLQPPPSLAVPAPPNISFQAYNYMQRALDFVQETWIGRDRVDWVALRRRAVMGAASVSAQTSADTYSALEEVVASLNDPHTQFATPQDVSAGANAIPEPLGITASYAKRVVMAVEANSPAEKAGVRAGDTILSVNGAPIEQLGASLFFAQLYGGERVDLMLRRDGQQSAEPLQVSIRHEKLEPRLVPAGRRLAGDIGYITLPTTIADSIGDKYPSIMQQIIGDIDQTPTCGWVVDLQLDTGGSIPWMVAGVGPILGTEGDGALGTFIDVNGKTSKWSYRNGKYMQDDTVYLQVEDPYELKRSMVPVAVLTGSGTGSAGEATLISFRGRPNTQTFGQPTYGVPTNRSAKAMEDGAYITVSSTLEADRTGHVYGMNEKIAPDQKVMTSPRSIGTDSDSVLQIGVAWLNRQTSCAK